MNLVHLAGCDGTDPDSMTRFEIEGIAHAATRNMACCAVAGQGAGIAAAVSIRCQRPLDQVDIGQLQQELDRQGVRHR